MKKTALQVAGFALALILAGPALPATAAAATDRDSSDAEMRTLQGQYKWVHQSSPGPLRAEFTSTGEGTWDVAFHFRFDGRDRTYLGTAEGALSTGRLSGKVFNENQRRTFIFRGEFDEGGRFEGTHEETTSSRAGRTGTLSLVPTIDS